MNQFPKEYLYEDELYAGPGVSWLALVPLMAGGQRKMTDVTRLTVATDATWPPMEFIKQDQEIVGFDIDLMNAIAEEPAGLRWSSRTPRGTESLRDWPTATMMR